MGISILDLVLRRLREANFPADVAFPGQKFPKISEPVAAVHLEKVDRSGMTVTVEINIICPAAMGGTTCEVEALRATEILQWAGAVCVQNGCCYDGVAQVYTVQILATFTGVTGADSHTIWPGFYVYINDDLQLNAVAFSEEEICDITLEHVMGEENPAGILEGAKHWSIRLEELIPAGASEIEDPAGDFTLQLVTREKTETYTGCRWTSVHRDFTKNGLRKTRVGFAQSREEA